jgi:hypothetical protein
MDRKKRTAACTQKSLIAGREAEKVMESLVKLHSFRTKVIVKISEWALEGKIKIEMPAPYLMWASDSPPILHLEWLLGEESWDLGPLTKLAGPHGFTFYKILEAQRKGKRERRK